MYTYKTFQIYRIETERLVIRCFEPKDAKLYREAVIDSLSELLPWMSWAKDEPETLEQKIERMRKYRGNFDLGVDCKFGIFNKDETQLLGSIGLHDRNSQQKSKEIGYWANTKHSKKGYITEAVQALMKVAFNIDDLNKILVKCRVGNNASISIPQRLGYHIVELKDKEVVLFRMYRSAYWKMDYSNISVKAFNAVGEEVSTEPRSVEEEKVEEVKETKNSFKQNFYRNFFNKDSIKDFKYTKPQSAKETVLHESKEQSKPKSMSNDYWV